MQRRTQLPARIWAQAIALGALLASECLLPAQIPTAGPAQGLMTVRQVAKVPPQPVYGQRPLTVECAVKLNSRQGYNIIIAHEPKSSATHWELFTAPGSGVLAAYLPGCQPDHLWTTTNVADGQWHDIALVLEERHGQLWVDGAPAAEQALDRKRHDTVTGPLVIGALDSGELGCDGQVQWVRLSKVTRKTGAFASQAPRRPARSVRSDDP